MSIITIYCTKYACPSETDSATIVGRFLINSDIIFTLLYYYMYQRCFAMAQVIETVGRLWHCAPQRTCANHAVNCNDVDVI